MHRRGFFQRSIGAVLAATMAPFVARAIAVAPSLSKYDLVRKLIEDALETHQRAFEEAMCQMDADERYQRGRQWRDE